MKIVHKLSKSYSIGVSNNNSNIQSTFIQSVYNFKYIKATTSFDKLIKRLKKDILNLAKLEYRINLLSVLTVPFIIVTSLSLLDSETISQNISLASMAISMFLIVTVPVILGMVFRGFASNAAIKFEPVAKKISIGLFVIVLLGAILAEKDNIVSYFADAGLITLALNVIMMVVAFYVAQLLATGNAQKKCIAIECGLQNGTLAIFVGTTLFGGGAFVIPAATYSLIMFATSLIFVFLVKNN